MSSYESTKHDAASKAGEAKEGTKVGAGSAKDKTTEATGIDVTQKAREVSDKAAEKWEQTKQTSSDATNVAGEKLEQTKQASAETAKTAQEKTGSVLQSVGNTVTDAFEKLKETVVPGGKQH